ncbi:MAG: TetR/AcrR family transcriptional regulator [Actinomycetota bacterium]|nr:TetR/AcrR family transcriptional regulator [Actinomycetota bacterium]
MMAAGRRPRVEGDREAEVLDAAVRVLADVGYDRLTMDEVASAARASKATLYRRWESKADLVVDAVSRTKGIPDAEATDTGSLRGDLLSLSCGPCGQAHQLPMSVLGGLLTALQTDPELSTAWRERFMAPRMAVTRTVFERAMSRGELRPGLDLELMLTVLPSMCVFRCTVQGRVVDEDFVARVLDHVVLPAVRPGNGHLRTQGHHS